MTTKNKLVVLGVLLLMVGCDPISGTGLSGDFDRSGNELSVVVTFHDNVDDLRRSYQEQFGEYYNDQLGYSVWKNPGNQPYTCEIHTLRPKYDGDDAMDTLGHELTHCLIGRFHEGP